MIFTAALCLLLWFEPPTGVATSFDTGRPENVASELTSEAARTAVAAYLAEIDEIDRVAQERKSAAKEKLLQSLEGIARFEALAGSRHRGMLGSYFNLDGRLPFVMLSVPNGENAFGEYAQSVFNGRCDMTKGLASFHARGHVVIPQGGTYCLEASRGYCDFKLNGMGYSLGTPVAGNRYQAEVELAEGVYEVYFSAGNNGGQLPEAAIRILDKASGAELPIFVYESEAQEFLGDRSFGVELFETSKWTPEVNKLE